MEMIHHMQLSLEILDPYFSMDASFSRSRVKVCVFETNGAVGLNKSWVLTLEISWMKWFAN